MNKCEPIRDRISKDLGRNNQRGPVLFPWTMQFKAGHELAASSSQLQKRKELGMGTGQCVEPEDEANTTKDGAKEKNQVLVTTHMLSDKALLESFLNHSDL